MGNGWVQRTRRSTVERVIERVHTDVNEMVPVHHGGMNGGAGSGHLGGGAGNHGAGSNGWLNGELARQVHNKFEDMVRQSPAPTRAERSAYDELVRSFPTPESRGRLMLGDGSADARDAGIVSPPAAPWMNGPGSGSDRYPSRLANGGGGDRTAADGGVDASGSPNERSLFSDLKSPPPSMRKASGGSGAGFTLDDLILRKKGPDAAKGGASRGAIFSPQPSPPRRGGRGGNARGRKPAAAKKPPTPEPSESSSESDEPSTDADGDYVSPGGGDRSPLEKLAHAAEKRASARDVGGGGSPGLRSPSGKKKKSPAARKSHRIGDSDSDDDGNKISAVRAGKTTKGSKGSGGAKRGSREAQQLLIAAQRMARVSANKAAKEATTPAAPAVTATRSDADTPGSTGGGRSGGRSTRERRAPSAFWLNEDAKRKDPFAKTPTSAAEPKSPKKPAAKAKPGPKPKSSAKAKAKTKAKTKSKPVAKRRRDDDDSSESSSSESSEDGSESESESEEETLEARVARNASAVKRSLEKRMKGRSPKKGPAAHARPAKKNAAKPIVYSESEDDDESEEDDEDDDDEEEDDEDKDVPPPKGDDDTEESDGDDDDDTEESDEDSDDDTPLASRYKSKPSKAAASPKGGKKPAPKPSPKKPNRRHSAEHAAALVSAEIMGRKTSIAKRFGLNVARVVDSEAESSDEEVESSDDEDEESPGSTPTDASSDRTDASSPETATDGDGDTTGDDDATPATKGSKPAAEGTTPGSSGRSIEKGKRGGWRPGAGRPRKPDDPNDPTPRKRRRLPGEPPRKRGRPRKIPTLEDIEAGHIRRKPASAEEKAAALRMLGGGSIFGNDDGADPKARGRPRKDAKSQEPQQKRQPAKAKAPVKGHGAGEGGRDQQRAVGGAGIEGIEDEDCRSRRGGEPGVAPAEAQGFLRRRRRTRDRQVAAVHVPEETRGTRAAAVPVRLGPHERAGLRGEIQPAQVHPSNARQVLGRGERRRGDAELDAEAVQRRAGV
jgi:hypothetical protein